MRRWMIVAVLVLCVGGSVVLLVRDSDDARRADPAVGELKAAVPQLLSGDDNIGVMPDLALAERDAWTRKRTTGTGLEQLRATIATLWTEDRVEEVVEEWRTGLRSVIGDGEYVPYDLSIFTVTAWRSVDVDGSRATVVLRGRPGFRVRGTWSAEHDGTYTVTLRRSAAQTVSDPGWRLDTVVVSDQLH